MSTSSTIVEEFDTLRKLGQASLAIHFFDFREDKKKDLRGFLTSVLSQLCDQSDSYYDILSSFYSSHHRDGAQSPSDDQLTRCLNELLGLSGQPPVYLIIDGLDECPHTPAFPSPRERVLALIVQLIESRLTNLRICVTGRPETDIKVQLEPLNFRSFALHDERGQLEDIENYIKHIIITDPKTRRWRQEDKQRVVDTLTERAYGR